MKPSIKILILVCTCLIILIGLAYLISFHKDNNRAAVKKQYTTSTNQNNKLFNTSSTIIVENSCGIDTKILSNKPLSYLLKMVDKYPEAYNFLKSEPLKTRLRSLLKDKFAILMNYWQVKGPLEQKFGYLVADACRAYYCGDNNFTILIDVNKDKIYVKYKNKDDFKIFSEDLTSPPPCFDLNQDNAIVNASYDDVINNVDKYKGMRVRWRGVISNLSQIDGIKFWIIDKNHQLNENDIVTNKYVPWFWYTPNDYFLEQFNVGDNVKFEGSWVKYMFAISSKLNYDQMKAGQVYYITGDIFDLDCRLYDYNVYNKQICIPDLRAVSIESD